MILLAASPPAAGQIVREPDAGDARQERRVVAVRTAGTIHLDGVLDEVDWRKAEPATEFIQQNPREGEPASERTEVRILYDQESVYFGVWAYDAEVDKIVVNTMEKDFSPVDNDGLCIYLDTFHDRRNGYNFCFNPVGAKEERQFVNEGRDINRAWEEVWELKTRITDEGWFAEVRIPFKSVRFSRADSQTWGVNFQRRIRRRYEQSFWAPIPRRFPVTQVSLAGILTGIEGIKPGRNFRLKPFLTAQFNQLAGDDFDTLGDGGLDLKYGLTPELTMDATANTDFSQVEVDDQQINLTRFSLFFPEKRDFFLENSGIFSFGQTDQFVASPRGGEREIIPFFSRRIGLSPRGTPLPILGGVRLTGHPGDYSLGLLNMQTRRSGPDPADNFTVFRVKRNILAYSEVGALWVTRQSSQSGRDNQTFGLDANFRFWQNFRLNSFLAATRTPSLEGDDSAGRLYVEWKTNLVEARSGFLDIGRNFNAEVGFVPRRDIRKSDSSFGLRPRPRHNRWVREFFPNVRFQYIMDHENRLITRTTNLEFRTEFQDGANVTLGRVLNFERLDQPFLIHRPVSIAAGDYHFDPWFVDLASDPSRPVSGGFRYENGDFWDGRQRGVEVGLAFKPHYRFTMTARYKRDDVRLRQGAFVTHLLNMRLNYSFSTRVFLNALIQYNSDLRKVSSNIRFHLIHRPLSDVFIVYNEQRDAFRGGVADKSLAVKYTHMLEPF